jgi:hypothetical protein
VALLSGSAICLAPTLAHADDLRIESIEQGTWPAAVAAAQLDRDSEGKTIHVVVKDDQGRRLACGEYSIAIDGPGADAFGSSGCDPETNATSVRVLHRAALFDHNDRVPRPRAPRIMAQRVQVGAAAGGAKQSGGSVVSCTADVRPFVDDLESGGRVALTPGRYELRVTNPDLDVRALPDGWRLTSHAGGARDVPYEVYDGKRNEVVFRDRVKMACEGDGAGSVDDVPATSVRTIDASGAGSDSTVRLDTGRPGDSDKPASGDWDGHAWTFSVFGGPAYMHPSGQSFSSGGQTQDASVFGLGSVASTAIGLNVAYERPGIYTSLGGQAAYVSVNGFSLFEYGVMSTVAAALHVGDTTIYLGPHVGLGAYQLTGVSGTDWSGAPAFSVGAAAGFRLHLRGDDAKAWVFGGEVVAPVAGPEPWFFVASLGWGGAS